MLERAARGGDPSAWRYRVAPLPRSRWVQVDTRSYVSPAWLPLTDPRVTEEVGGFLSVQVNGKTYSSRRFVTSDELIGYSMRG